MLLCHGFVASCTVFLLSKITSSIQTLHLEKNECEAGPSCVPEAVSGGLTLWYMAERCPSSFLLLNDGSISVKV